jgi:hypothetical protein
VGPGSKRLSSIGLRIGRCWLEEGQHRGALGVLLAVLPYTTGAAFVEATAGAARASAAVGWAWNFEASWNATWRMLRRADPAGQVSALLQLARGAATGRDWLRARVSLFTAFDMAVALKDPELFEQTAKMLAVASMPEQAGDEAVHETFPDLRAARLGLVADWDEADPVEPWSVVSDVRAVVDAFSRAIKAAPGDAARTAAP